MGRRTVRVTWILGLLLMLAILFDVHDVWPTYFANPTFVRGLRVVEGRVERTQQPTTAHDWNGDGSADDLSVEYFHMEPFFADPTSGLIRVRSGADGSDLLAYPIPTPMSPVSWAGDHDGNGTDDLCLMLGAQSLSLRHEP